MAMGALNPTALTDPNKYMRRSEYAPVTPRVENADSPRTLPFQAQLGLHENIDLTIALMQAEQAQQTVEMTRLVKQVEEMISPPIMRDKVVLLGTGVAMAGFYPFRKRYPFAGAEKWMLEKLTLMPRNGTVFPTYVSIIVEGEDQEPYYLNNGITSVEPEVILFGGQALIFNTGDAANAGTVLVRWRRLWTIENGHE
jgi:hypothetical protein